MMVHKLWLEVLVGCLLLLLACCGPYPRWLPACFLLAVVQYFFEILSSLPSMTIYWVDASVQNLSAENRQLFLRVRRRTLSALLIFCCPSAFHIYQLSSVLYSFTVGRQYVIWFDTTQDPSHGVRILTPHGILQHFRKVLWNLLN